METLKLTVDEKSYLSIEVQKQLKSKEAEMLIQEVMKVLVKHKTSSITAFAIASFIGEISLKDYIAKTREHDIHKK